MSVAPLFPQKPEKMVVPTGVSWRQNTVTDNLSHFVNKFARFDTTTLSHFVALTSDSSCVVLLCLVSLTMSCKHLLSVLGRDEGGTH